MDCQICYTTVPRVIQCPACNYNTCKKCLETYSVSQTDINCPSCSVVFTREFIATAIPGFLKTYKTMREKYLLDREMALMPETQTAVVAERRRREAAEEMAALTARLREISQEAKELRQRIAVLRAGAPVYGAATAQAAQPARAAVDPVVCKCAADDCRGFVTESTHACGLCGLGVCKKCMMTLGDGHECKKEDVESATLLKKSSKPCPKCAAPIFKIDGCDQMWCTQCQTAFSWSTGKIETGKVHNPHYYEWQRKMHNGQAPRVEGDRPPGCVQDITYGTLMGFFAPGKAGNRLGYVHRLVTHIQAVHHAPARVDNTNLRVKYLLGEIDQKKLATRLQQVDKLYQKNTDVFQVYEAVVEGGKAIFQEMWSTTNERRRAASRQWFIPDHEKDAYVRRFDALIEFGNAQMQEISKKYKMVAPVIRLDNE
jgi:hypothetical protein